MSPARVNSVLFDLDDTLLDRPRSLRELTRRFMGRFSGRLADLDEGRVYGSWVEADASGYKPRSVMAREILSSVGWTRAPEPKEIEDFWYREFPSCSILEDGAEELLSFLTARGVKTGVITNGGTDFQKAKIAHVGLGRRLGVVIISDEVGMRKPDPCIFLLAMEKLGTAPGTTVFVGDNPEIDVMGARNVGMRAIWKRARLPWPETLQRPEMTVMRLDEIMTVLDDGGPAVPMKDGETAGSP